MPGSSSRWAMSDRDIWRRVSSLSEMGRLSGEGPRRDDGWTTGVTQADGGRGRRRADGKGRRSPDGSGDGVARSYNVIPPGHAHAKVLVAGQQQSL